MMSPKLLPLRIVVGLFVLAMAATPLAYRLLRGPAAPPRTLTELTELLSRDASSLYVVPIVEGNPEAGIYLCTRSRTRDQLMGLPRAREHAHRWQGVAHCEMVGKMVAVDEYDIQSWGEYGMQIGPFLFFGDPDLLQRIRKVVLDRQRE
jgi:hypothetical protein